ncbi:structural maintenance of chromosomes protein 2 [Agrilus planipennis]|uniref:Structural maintenance of chromosomes protein 2 n=1 Tax=Agrilus planipennis TaxID=224129 RepID=A0A7F5R481_AGRPL|nr:structural maintenance of chromosomes protein 2 [Agrilus planipennis]
MYIKSIVLDGFKSYGQRTEIHDFDQQFNAITGLNGTGKSNVLDAICFVLGISNLSQVRACSLQDLIYKNGQAGVNKATVSITFDNRNQNQSPPGFENFNEITVTRQVVMGGKNRYMINGTNVHNKRVQDLFCSVQLNVNNPHFLIMQGRITKVLNMKPPEILSMVEEAAGTRMYENKRQVAKKLLEKKDAKLLQLTELMAKEIGPKLEKLKEERKVYLEYQRIERELEHMNALYLGFQYFATQRASINSQQALEKEQSKLHKMQDEIKNNVAIVKDLEKEIEDMTKLLKDKADSKLQELEVELRAKEKEEAKANAAEKSLKDNITTEEKNIKQLQKNLKDDESALNTKEKELSQVQSLFEKLKNDDVEDNEAFALSQRKYEAICAGMEVNESGEAETLQEQLMNAKQEATEASVKIKETNMQLKHFQEVIQEKTKTRISNVAEYERDKITLEKMQKEVRSLENSLEKLKFSEEKLQECQTSRKNLIHEVRRMGEKIERFEAQNPYATINYTDPEPNFNRSNVKGVVCRLINLKDNATATAIETAAGGKLYNVVVTNDVTGKKLLQKGNLQNRTTFIPLNKIQGGQIDNATVQYAQKLVGKDNVQTALSLVTYDKELQPAMEYVFGNVFVCKDLDTARKITFNDRIRRRCVTLEGDVTDPGGTLSGGARQKGPSVLLQLQGIKEIEASLKCKENELMKIENEVKKMLIFQEQFATLSQQLELRQHELGVVQQRFQQTAHHQQQVEINELQNKIGEMKETIKQYKEIEAKALHKVKEIENKLKDSKGHKERVLKEAEKEMNTLKKKADNSRKNWKLREQEYETLNVEITELKKSLESVQQQLQTAEERLNQLKSDYEEAQKKSRSLKETVTKCQQEYKAEKSAMVERNKEIHKKNSKKEALLAQNTELELEIKKMQHELKKLKDEYAMAKAREEDISKKVKTNCGNLKEAESLTDKEADELERKIRSYQDKRGKLGRTVNAKAQSLFEHEEKQFNLLVKKKNIVEIDKRRIVLVMQDLDKKKKDALMLAWEQVSKDFGSIFGTLLPGSNAKLQPPRGQSVLDGLEVKVSLGGVWKESLSELSGGQRSLVALSLILAMLLFKPAPLYILDEVDAALDLSHTQNIGHMLKTHFKQSQFIIVSLKDGMFNNANVLFKTKFVDGVSAITRTVNRN